MYGVGCLDADEEDADVEEFVEEEGVVGTVGISVSSGGLIGLGDFLDDAMKNLVFPSILCNTLPCETGQIII